MARLALLPLVPLLAPALAIAPLEAQQYVLEGDRVAVYNLAGKVTIEAGSGKAVVVRATPGGSDAGRLRFEQGTIKGRSTLRVIYPGTDVAYAGLQRGDRTSLRVRDDGTFDTGGWGDDGRRVTISADRGVQAHADLAIAVPAGRRVEVYLAVGTLSATNVQGELRLDASSADVRVASHRGGLTVDAGSGNAEVTDVEGEVLVDVGSGSVRLSRIASAGEVRIDAGSGNVTGSGIRARELDVDTGSGTVELSAVQASSVRIDTGSGDVTVDLAADAETVAVDAGSGDVELRLPATFGAQVDVETGSGDITTEFALQVSRTGDEALEGTLGDGRGRLEVETGSGDVRLLKR